MNLKRAADLLVAGLLGVAVLFILFGRQQEPSWQDEEAPMRGSAGFFGQESGIKEDPTATAYDVYQDYRRQVDATRSLLRRGDNPKDTEFGRERRKEARYFVRHKHYDEWTGMRPLGDQDTEKLNACASAIEQSHRYARWGIKFDDVIAEGGLDIFRRTLAVISIPSVSRYSTSRVIGLVDIERCNVLHAGLGLGVKPSFEVALKDGASSERFSHKMLRVSAHSKTGWRVDVSEDNRTLSFANWSPSQWVEIEVGAEPECRKPLEALFECKKLGEFGCVQRNDIQRQIERLPDPHCLKMIDQRAPKYQAYRTLFEIVKIGNRLVVRRDSNYPSAVGPVQIRGEIEGIDASIAIDDLALPDK